MTLDEWCQRFVEGWLADPKPQKGCDMQPKNDAKLARSYGPDNDVRPKFKFRIDLVPDGLVATPVFVMAADHADALDKLHDRMGIVPVTVDGQPLKVSS